MIGPKCAPTEILKSDGSILKCSNLIGPKCAPAEILKSDWSILHRTAKIAREQNYTFLYDLYHTSQPKRNT